MNAISDEKAAAAVEEAEEAKAEVRKQLTDTLSGLSAMNSPTNSLACLVASSCMATATKVQRLRRALISEEQACVRTLMH